MDLPEPASPPPPELLALTDIRHYQREPSESDFPPPGRSSLASPEERIQRLEELVDGLGTMLDMVKEQVRGSPPSHPMMHIPCPKSVLYLSGTDLGADSAGKCLGCWTFVSFLNWKNLCDIGGNNLASYHLQESLPIRADSARLDGSMACLRQLQHQTFCFFSLSHPNYNFFSLVLCQALSPPGAKNGEQD